MANVKHGLKMACLGTVATMMLTACGRDNKDNTADPVISAKITQLNHGIDSLSALINNTQDKCAPFQNRVQNTNDEIRALALNNGRLYCLALADYMDRLNAQYPIKTVLNASDANYFSNLAKKILAHADKKYVLAPFIRIGRMEDPSEHESKNKMAMDHMAMDRVDRNGIVPTADDHRAYLTVNIGNPIDAVRRVANGTGAVMDIEVMVRATTFGELGMSREEITELKKYVSLGITNSVKQDTPAGRAIEQCFEKLNEASVAGLRFNRSYRIYTEAKPEMESALKAKLEEHIRAVDPDGVGINFSIPEMQKIQAQFMANVAQINEKQALVTPDAEKLDSLNQVWNGYAAEKQRLQQLKDSLMAKQK